MTTTNVDTVTLDRLEHDSATWLPRPFHVGERAQPGVEHIGRLLDWAALTGVSRFAEVRLVGGWMKAVGGPGRDATLPAPALDIEPLRPPADQLIGLGGWTIEITEPGRSPMRVELTVDGLVRPRGTEAERNLAWQEHQAKQLAEHRRLREVAGHATTDRLWSTTRERGEARKVLDAADEAWRAAIRAAVESGISWVDITRATGTTHDEVREIVEMERP